MVTVLPEVALPVVPLLLPPLLMKLTVKVVPLFWKK